MLVRAAANIRCRRHSSHWFHDLRLLLGDVCSWDYMAFRPPFDYTFVLQWLDAWKYDASTIYVISNAEALDGRTNTESLERR